MLDQERNEFIARQKSKGFSDETIQKLLEHQDWPEERKSYLGEDGKKYVTREYLSALIDIRMADHGYLNKFCCDYYNKRTQEVHDAYGLKPNGNGCCLDPENNLEDAMKIEAVSQKMDYEMGGHVAKRREKKARDEAFKNKERPSRASKLEI